ncbi:MAG: hypothetical protein K6U89_14990 [Chloroflexi bacterium]|nr:hypothetical protein [Chloroflexota bacterium]
MWQSLRRGLMFGLGFWLVPLVIVLALTSAGIVAGVASTSPVTTAVPSVEARFPPPGTVTPRPAQPAPRANAAEGTIVAIGRQTSEGRVIFVQDRPGRRFQLLVTAQTIVKKNGQRVRPPALRVGDVIVSIGTRQSNGQFRAAAILVLPPPNEIVE